MCIFSPGTFQIPEYLKEEEEKEEGEAEKKNVQGKWYIAWYLYK